MNDDLIKRSDALKVAYRYCPDDDGSCSCADRDLREMLNDMEDIPSADRPQGEWIRIEWNEHIEGRIVPMRTYKCSTCGEKEVASTRFCPNCGAMMKGADDE